MHKFEKQVEIVQKDDEQQRVWGVFSVSKVGEEHLVDLQDDIIEAHELEEAAYDFVLNAREAGSEHTKIEGIGKLIESFVLTPEKAIWMEKALRDVGADATIRPDSVAWVGAFHVEDEATWDAVKKGELQDFSIGGAATRDEVE